MHQQPPKATARASGTTKTDCSVDHEKDACGAPIYGGLLRTRCVLLTALLALLLLGCTLLGAALINGNGQRRDRGGGGSVHSTGDAMTLCRELAQGLLNSTEPFAQADRVAECASRTECGWGRMRFAADMCAPDETQLRQWAQLAALRDSSDCQAPGLGSWSCRLLLSGSKAGDGGALYDSYLREYASAWTKRVFALPILSTEGDGGALDRLVRASCSTGELRRFGPLAERLRREVLYSADSRHPDSYALGVAAALGVGPLVLGAARDPRGGRASPCVVVLAPRETLRESGTSTDLAAYLLDAPATELIPAGDAAARVKQAFGLWWAEFWRGVQRGVSIAVGDTEAARVDYTATDRTAYEGRMVWLYRLDPLTSTWRLPSRVDLWRQCEQEWFSLETRPKIASTRAATGLPESVVLAALPARRSTNASESCALRVAREAFDVYAAQLRARVSVKHRLLDPHSRLSLALQRIFTQLLEAAASLARDDRPSHVASAELRERFARKALDARLVIEPRAPGLTLPRPAGENGSLLSSAPAAEPESYWDLVGALRAARTARHLKRLSLGETDEDEAEGETLYAPGEPSLHYARASNTLHVNVFYASPPLFPHFDEDPVVSFARIGWRMARELYSAFDPLVGGAYDGEGRVQDAWLYGDAHRRVAQIREELGAECAAYRFAFCVVIRAVNATTLVQGALDRSGPSGPEWLSRLFWGATLSNACQWAKELDACLENFPPYRSAFDCTHRRRGAYYASETPSYSDGSGRVWHSCMPYD